MEHRGFVGWGYILAAGVFGLFVPLLKARFQEWWIVGAIAFAYFGTVRLALEWYARRREAPSDANPRKLGRGPLRAREAFARFRRQRRR